MVSAEPQGRVQTNEKASPERRACLVDYYDKLSNLLEDLLTLDQFVESIESELNGN